MPKGWSPYLKKAGGAEAVPSVLASEHGYSKRAGLTIRPTDVQVKDGKSVLPNGSVLVETPDGFYMPATGVPSETEAPTAVIVIDGPYDLTYADGPIVIGALVHGSVIRERIPGFSPELAAALPQFTFVKG